MAKNNALNFNLPSVDDLFSTEESRAEAKLERIVNLNPSEISNFPNHPFKVRMDSEMLELIDSVKQHGILLPALVRPKPEGGYEMVSGHRRKKAAELAGFTEIPCIVRNLDNDEAIIVMVDSNLQRERVLPSEKAFAYKMKLDAMKRQGQRTDLTSGPVGQKSSRDELADSSPDSSRQIQRYIRLTNLIPEILELVDNSVLKDPEMLQIAMRPAVELADIQTADMLHLPVPKANFHTEVIKPSELQQEMVKGLAERAEKIRDGGVDPHVDNMLRITNDGRKLALDMRLINPLAADDPNGKVAVCARNVYKIWEQTKEQRSTQLVFCDLSTPTKDGSFNVYDDLKKKLMEQGIPEDEIAFIHDADSEVKKKALFAKVRAGQIRVLMGSTQKMGAGTNVQDRLIALHDLDCPWRPSDLQQRLGRIVRQGNENEEVEIFRYVTEGTFDAYLYQLVENKQKFIAQIMTSKAPVRVADDVDETALSYSEIKALATGNPLIIEKCNLDMEVAKLNMLKASYLNQRYSLEELVLREYPADIARITERIAGYEKDVALAAAHPKGQEGFCGMVIEGKQYAEKEDAGKAIIDVCSKMTGSDAVLLGEYRGFSMVLAYDGISNEYRITLKGTLSHTVTLGADVFGNIARLDNALENLAGSLQAEQSSLEETKGQLENARAELGAPFAREEELAEKTARLNELNVLLKVDEKDKTLIDSVPDEGEEVPERKVVGLER